jgi:hypothetical protein
MSVGFRELHAALQGSKEDVLDTVNQLVSDQGSTYQSSHLQLVAGQQDLIRNLQRISQNFTDALRDNQNHTALAMEKLLSEQYAATEGLLTDVYQRDNEAMKLQLCKLVRQSHQKNSLNVKLIMSPGDSNVEDRVARNNSTNALSRTPI